MPGRSPHRRSPFITRLSPERSRVRSPRRQHLEMASSSRGRERREYRPTIRRSRSPIPPKRRSYSPPLKRKASPVVERELSRRPKISKSPIGSRGNSRGAPEPRYNNSAVEPALRPVSNITASSERFREREYEDREGGGPKFRGPEESVDYSLHDLKRFKIEIVRNLTSVPGESSINRSITNPEDIVIVRRPGMRGGVEGQQLFREYYNNRGKHNVRGRGNYSYNHNHQTKSQKWNNHQEEEDEESYGYNAQNEGCKPLFLRAESSSNKDRSAAPPEDYQRIVAIDNSRGSGRERGQSRERPSGRYSPAPGPSHYEDSRKPYYSERERGHSPYEARHRSPHRDEYSDKHRERRGGSRDDIKRGEFVIRKKEERRYSPERRLSYEREQRESDLRSRINEKRSDPHTRIEERDRDRRYESERERGERQGRSHHSSPPRERRRPASPERHEGSRDRREAWERDRDREGRERESRRHHSRERESREHSGSHYEESRRQPSSHKNDYEPKKFYKTYEPKEFVPIPMRGRGMPMRRGVPPIMRGRGMVRGMNRGFRGGIMIPRGIPRGGPFIPRGFPPRGFFPPY